MIGRVNLGLNTLKPTDVFFELIYFLGIFFAMTCDIIFRCHARFGGLARNP